MFRADPDSTTSMPRGLLVVAAALFALRIIADVMPERHAPDMVAWNDPSSAVAAAATSGSMPVLYYFSASWCQPCRRLDKDVFHDADMASYVNARFVPIRVDAGDSAPADHAPDVRRLMTLHQVTSFPTLIIARPGQEPLTLVGYPSRRKVLALLYSILPPKP